MTADIPLLDLHAHNAPLHDEIMAAIGRVTSSNRFILGEEVAGLEAEVAAALEVNHAIGVSSGTDALLVALMASGVGAGDEVITTPFSFFATAGCIARLGARPVFVDVDPRTLNLDPAAVEAHIGPRTKALLPVHLYGQPCDMRALCEIACRHDLPIVEDAAQAISARHALGPVGALGRFGCFSFFPSKNLGGFGDGGLVTTQDETLAEQVRVLRGHGAKPKYFHALVGGNFRLDALQAAILRVKLPHLGRWTEARRANAARYTALFDTAGLPEAWLRTPPRVESGHVFNQYVIRSVHRDALRKHLQHHGIGTEIYYPKPLHLQDCFAHLGYAPGSLPEAERAAGEVLALPIYPELSAAQIERVAETTVDFFRKQ